MQIDDFFKIDERLYSVLFEWLPEDAIEDSEDDDKEVCEGCGLVHGVWDEAERSVSIKGDAIDAAELVKKWVMSDDFKTVFGETSIGVRILSVECIGPAPLTPLSVK